MVTTVKGVERATLVAKIRDYCKWLVPDYAGQPGACLWLALSTIRVLTKKGHVCLLQAGTCMWPRLTPEQDDGKPETHSHYSYVWEPDNPVTRGRLAADLMPECHCWAAQLTGPAGESYPQVIDLSTGTIPENCLATTGMDWPGVRPPEYLWCTPEALPDSALYHASADAIKAMTKLIYRVLVH